MIRTIAGGVDVVTAGTAVALASVRTSAAWAHIQAKPSNTGNIYLGLSNVSSVNAGVVLQARDGFLHPTLSDINLYDLAGFFIDADVNGEGVFVYFAVR